MQVDKPERVKCALKEYANVEKRGFGGGLAPIAFAARCRRNVWEFGKLGLLKDAKISSAACGVHYSQSVFEGLKAFINQRDEVAIFRPRNHFERLEMSAKAMRLPAPPYEVFITGLESMVRELREYIPKSENGSLYLRPFLIGTEKKLSLDPANESLFLVVATPIHGYFAGTSISSRIQRLTSRVQAGRGKIKASANYASNYFGNDGNSACDLWLSKGNSIEEFSAMNFFCVRDGVILTPPLTDSILEGVTRASVITICERVGIPVSCEAIDIEDLLTWIREGLVTEVFGTGTGAGIVKIQALLDGDDGVYQLNSGDDLKADCIIRHLNQIYRGDSALPFVALKELEQDWRHLI